MRFSAALLILAVFTACGYTKPVYVYQSASHFRVIYKTVYKNYRNNIPWQLVEKRRKLIVFLYTKTADDKPFGTGTGFVADKEKGIILTAYHIIRSPFVHSIYVRFFDGNQLVEKKVQWHLEVKDDDIAVLKVDYRFEDEAKINIRTPGSGKTFFTIGYADQLSGDPMEQKVAFGEYYMAKEFPYSFLYRPELLGFSMHAANGASGSPIFDDEGNAVALLTNILPSKPAFSSFVWAVPAIKFQFLIDMAKNHKP